MEPAKKNSFFEVIPCWGLALFALIGPIIEPN